MRQGAGPHRELFLVLVAAVLFLTAVTSRPVLRLFFPVRYASLIEEAARTYRLDSHLLSALVRVESAFDPSARSAKGAVGLMQLMPDTAAWIASQRRLPRPGPAELAEPRVNIDYGSWYFRMLLDDFHGDAILALAAYNSGWGTVRGWLGAGEWSGQPDEIEQIPFPETRAYVRRVLATWKWYERLYPDKEDGHA